jgi:hypothetical protein
LLCPLTNPLLVFSKRSDSTYPPNVHVETHCSLSHSCPKLAATQMDNNLWYVHTMENDLAMKKE